MKHHNKKINRNSPPILSQSNNKPKKVSLRTKISTLQRRQKIQPEEKTKMKKKRKDQSAQIRGTKMIKDIREIKMIREIRGIRGIKKIKESSGMIEGVCLLREGPTVREGKKRGTRNNLNQNMNNQGLILLLKSNNLTPNPLSRR